MREDTQNEIDELIDCLGPADAIRLHGTDISTWIWTIDEEGDGIALARSATRNGLGGQARALLSADYGGRSLRTLIVAPGMCGNRRFHERPDLLEIGESIDAGWCKRVAVRDLDRISRTFEAVDLFVDYLSETGIDLFVTSHSSEEPFELRSPLLEFLALPRPRVEPQGPRRDRASRNQ